MHRLALGIAASLVMTWGCGVYGVRFEPTPNDVLPADRTPIDLSVSLGEVEAYANGERIVLDPSALAEVDARFVRAAREAGMFPVVLPRGSTTDLVCDVTSRLHAAPTSVARGAYLFFVAPLAVLTPGFPHPWDYRVEREVRIWGKVAGASIPLRRERVVYDERVWGASYWGGFAADPLIHEEGEYLHAALARAVAQEPSIFRSFAAAARAGDLENAWLLGERARAAPSAF
jgi:hypothetical protein